MKKALLVLAASAAWTPLRAQSVSFPVAPMQTVGMRFPGPRLPMVDIRLPSQGLPIQPVFFQASVLPRLSFPQPQGPAFPVPVGKPHWPAAPVKLEPATPAGPAKPSRKPKSSEPREASTQSLSLQTLEASWKKGLRAPEGGGAALSAPEGGEGLAARLQAAFDGSLPEEVAAAPEPVDTRPSAPTQNLPEWELERDLGVR